MFAPVATATVLPRLYASGVRPWAVLVTIESFFFSLSLSIAVSSMVNGDFTSVRGEAEVVG